MSDHIKVTFAELQSVQDRTAATVAAVNGQLDDLRSYLAPIVATWTGAAAEAYQAKQNLWDLAAADLNGVLSSIGRTLGAANEGYQTTEVANAARFA